MPRALLPEERIHPAVRAQVVNLHRAVIDEVQSAIDTQAVVVVGMRQNPYPRKARALLDQAGIAYRYLEYGSYFSGWQPRLALKMWSGWPTFPMVFVKGMLVGGFSDLEALHRGGELQRLVQGS